MPESMHADIIRQLEAAWSEDGVFGNLRQGYFDQEAGAKALELLHQVRATLDNDEFLPKRLVSLLWYIPSFLEWQTARVDEQGGDLRTYEKFVNALHNELENILGVP